MASERAQRHIDHLLDEAEEAITSQDWNTVGDRARSILRLDPESSDALAYLAAADREPDDSLSNQSQTPAPTLPDQPASFANGRYQVARFLGEGGKKKSLPRPRHDIGQGSGLCFDQDRGPRRDLPHPHPA